MDLWASELVIQAALIDAPSMNGRNRRSPAASCPVWRWPERDLIPTLALHIANWRSWPQADIRLGAP